jgi:hypothetical protein
MSGAQLDPFQEQIAESIRVVKCNYDHTLRLCATTDGDIVFYITNTAILASGMRRITRYFTPQFRRWLPYVLCSASHFYHHLRRDSSANSFMENVQVQAHLLKQHPSRDADGKIWLPNSSNLINFNTMVVDAGTEGTYGFKIINKSSEQLYASVFLFELADFSIG